MILITLGSIVKSVYGPNLIISELASNISILKGSTAQLDNVKFNTSLSLFIDRLFFSKRASTSKIFIWKRQQLCSACPKLELSDNHMVVRHLRTINLLPFSAHNAPWKNKIRFSLYDPNSPTHHCDSCLLFNDADNTITSGFIAQLCFIQ